MKSNSSDLPLSIQAIGDGKHIVRTNIVQKTNKDGIYWEADAVLVTDMTYGGIVEALIRGGFK